MRCSKTDKENISDATFYKYSIRSITAFGRDTIATMLLLVNKLYFSFSPERFADVIASLDEHKPFIAYPDFTRVESNGRMVSLSLDGRTTLLPNQELSILLARAQKTIAAAISKQESFLDPSPSP